MQQLYVGNLDYQTTESSLTNLFGQIGEVLSAKIIIDRDTGRSKGFGFIEMGSEEACQTAIAELNGKEFEGRELRVNEAQKKTSNNNRW